MKTTVARIQKVKSTTANTLKTNLDPETFDKVRAALGLEPLQVAAQKGKEISQKVRENLE